MTIGERLKQAREAKGIDLQKVHEQTKIFPDTLRALEDNKFDKILSSTYVRSFLKAYASYLGLDVKSIIDEYNQLSGKQEFKPKEHVPESGQYQNQHQQTLEDKKDGQDKNVKPFFGNAAVILKWLIILAVAFVLAKGAVRIFKNIVIVIKQSAAHAQTHTKTQQAKQPKKKQQQKTQALPQTKTNAQADVKDEVKAEAAQPVKISIPAKEKLELAITTTDDVWIRLKIDGKLIFENIIKKGSTESWTAQNNFSIWTGKAAALKIKLNNMDLGTAGKGVIKDLVIDREGLHNK